MLALQFHFLRRCLFSESDLLRDANVFSVRIDCHRQVKEIPGAVFESFETYEEAECVYNRALQRGEVKVIQCAASASATRTKHQTSSREEFDTGLDGNRFQPVTPSRRMNCVGGRAMQPCDSELDSLCDEMSLLYSSRRKLPPSPPTGVTQYMQLEDSPLLQTPRRLSPRVTVEDTSYTASLPPPKFRPAPIRRVQASPTSSMMQVEEASPPRAIRRQQTAPASFEMGARYPTVEEVHNGQGLDPRIMRPPSRIFDPANVKYRPRASSIVSARRKQPEDIQSDSTSPRDTTARLVADRLPVVNDLEDDGESSISSPPQRREADKGKSRALADVATEVVSAPSRVLSNERHSFSEYSHHIQEVYTMDTPGQRNFVVVHCPPGCNCCHHGGQCRSMTANVTVRNDGVRAQSHYVDAEVSPSVSSTRGTSPRKANVARVSDASSARGVHSFAGLSYSPQVPYRGYAAESDVRSPFAHGTRVPSGLSE